MASLKLTLKLITNSLKHLQGLLYSSAWACNHQSIIILNPIYVISEEYPETANLSLRIDKDSHKAETPEA